MTGTPGEERGAGSDDTVLLDAQAVTKSFRRSWWPGGQRTPVLRGADLALQPGEIVGLVGENGSGKSTLMKILVGALARDGGSLRREGTLGYCHQDPVLYERLTCDEHLDLFGAAYGLEAADLERSRAELYERLEYQRFADRRVDELSGGTRAKLNLTIAMLHDPRLLFLDEPYAGFDWDTYQRFWAISEERRDAGATLLVISHFIADEERFDRIYDLVEGKTVQR